MLSQAGRGTTHAARPAAPGPAPTHLKRTTPSSCSCANVSQSSMSCARLSLCTNSSTPVLARCSGYQCHQSSDM